jgi:outer membrane receptor protein involved in Fe transport
VGAIPANIEDLSPVWNNPSTWNLGPLSANSIRWSQSFGTYSWGHNQPNVGAWLQDNWAVNDRLTLNLGVRWDLAHNWGGQNYEFLPLRQKADNEWTNFGPRLGFAYQLPGGRTVIRGGWGKYFLGPKDQWAHHIPINQLLGIPSVPYDGRADFAVNPFNGPEPSLEAARAAIQDTVGWIASDTVKTPYSWQTSIGLQRQLGETIAVQADYVWVGGRRNEQFFNTNLTYNPATGVNYP